MMPRDHNKYTALQGVEWKERETGHAKTLPAPLLTLAFFPQEDFLGLEEWWVGRAGKKEQHSQRQGYIQLAQWSSDSPWPDWFTIK